MNFTAMSYQIQVDRLKTKMQWIKKRKIKTPRRCFVPTNEMLRGFSGRL
jgi:hypothetical protein